MQQSPRKMTRMATSWHALPNGDLVALSRTQELLLDMVPVVEDLLLVCTQLKSIQSGSGRVAGAADTGHRPRRS